MLTMGKKIIQKTLYTNFEGVVRASFNLTCKFWAKKFLATFFHRKNAARNFGDSILTKVLPIFMILPFDIPLSYETGNEDDDGPRNKDKFLSH
jgi:hypothetical protein